MQAKRERLKRAIGKKTLLMLIINALLGTGIFFLPAIGASIAGPASIISWILVSIIAIFMASYFAELASMFPKAGGIYEYTKKAFGKYPGFMIGWTTWILTNITIGMLIVGTLYYLLPGMHYTTYIVLSILIILFFNFISYRGIEISSKILMIFGIITLSVLLSLILPGLMHINVSNYQPFFINSFPAMLPIIFLAMFYITETFIGWETATFFAEEVKNVRRVLPKMMVYATIIIVLVAISLVITCLGVSNWVVFGASQRPMAFIADILYGKGAGNILTMIMFLPLIGAVAGWIISSPRLLFAMARDKALPAYFKKLHPKYNTPYRAISFQTITSIFVTIVGFGSYKLMLSLLLPLVLISYSAVLLCVLKLRMRSKLKRYFTAPAGKIGPIVILIINIALIIQWAIYVENALNLLIMDIIMILIGVPLYIAIKLETDREFIGKFFDRISWLWDKIFPIWYGKSELRKVVKNLHLKKGQKVLDFGCGTGLTTLEIAKRIGENGTVVAVDLSEKQLEKASKRIAKAMELSNVVFIKQQELIPFPKKSFDAITSVGVLEHFYDPEPALKHILSLLKPGGYFSFMSFGKSFGIPSLEFLSSEEEIRKIFKRLGYSVKIERERKRLTEYWFIYGRKPHKRQKKGHK